MITSVCLNPCIDKTVSVRTLNRGALNRILSSRTDAGGKGVNVAVTLSRLGEDTRCALFLPGEGSEALTSRLRNEHIGCDAVSLNGRLRTNLKIFDESDSRITEINESGVPVTDAALDCMAALIESCAKESELIVLSGSMPPACPPDYYKTLIGRLNTLPCRCVLDADGARLREGIKARPFLIKPNRPELEELIGEPLKSLADIRRAADRLVGQGVGMVAVSLGEEGALISDGQEALYATKLNIPVRSTVGAGDAMCAGLSAGIVRGESLETTFRLGMACSGAAVMSEGTRPIECTECSRLLDRVEIRRL